MNKFFKLMLCIWIYTATLFLILAVGSASFSPSHWTEFFRNAYVYATTIPTAILITIVLIKIYIETENEQSKEEASATKPTPKFQKA